jgi:hypothetical protein
MSIEEDVRDAIKPHVSNHAYMDVFPQAVSVPVWPAARISIISLVPDVDLCGDGGEVTAEYRIQIDLVVPEASGYSALKTLQAAVLATMQTFDPPAILDAMRTEYDEETRTRRSSIDYLIHPSSPA